jgi:hypothetical protein
MRYIVVFSLVVLMITLQSCSNIVANHHIVTEQRQVTGFTEVELSNQCDVVIENDSVFNVSVTAPDNIMTDIKTDVTGGVLKITTPSNININMNGEVATVHIKMPHPLNRVAISGSGNIDILSAFPHLSHIEISGSGNINANVAFAPVSLYTNISGSGNISLTGTSVNHTMTISGSGNIQGQNFVTANATCTISGSGNIYTTANSSLNATISGSGNIEYWGSPSVNSNISGSGVLIHH